MEIERKNSASNVDYEDLILTDDQKIKDLFLEQSKSV